MTVLSSPYSGGVKARDIIRDALTFHLNRLSPGETEDADTFGTALRGLNHIADAWSGAKLFLFAEVFTDSLPITGATGLLSVHWPNLSPGDEILGATYNNGTVIDRMSMAQYERVSDKTTAGSPRFYAPDGGETVYFYPAVSAQVVTLRTKQAMSNFDDLDTEYTMPAGYKSALSACLAELLSPVMNPSVYQVVKRAANAARARIGAQVIEPAILNPGVRGNILTGWN